MATRTQERSTKVDGVLYLPPGKTLEDFDWSFQPRVDRRQIETLATCSYLREKTNVLFLGPPGVGKSHLAPALGVKAIKNGFSVTHFVLDDLMHVLRADAAVPPARLRAKRYFNSALLIIDEVGFRHQDEFHRGVLLESLAIAFPMAIALAVVIESLQKAGLLPTLSVGDVWPWMALTWLPALWIAVRRYK